MSENNVVAQGRRMPGDPLIGSKLGPYQVVRLIGSGGMGRVYEGRQTGPINKKVALKVMRREKRSDLMRRRFEMELQTLAALNHPNIATIYLSGTRADGENWFAMEYVEGASLIEYCEQHRLKAPDRLKLFKKICGAVHFAHQRGIIHRDLKPANILVREVDGEAVPKVIDFGIAKITAEEKPCLDQATMVTELTAPGFAVGTLGYMSPEQTRLDEDDIDVRSDIYSLGVILYEMLVGKRPIDEKRIQSGTWDQAFALVRDHEPEKPSKAIRREALSHTTTLIDVSSVSGLSKYYRGDLDWIVLKAMEKNRERRYQGADLFAEDIDNFLNRRPIEAGPPTWTYQSMRFVQRHKAFVAGMVLVTAGLIMGFIGLVFGYIRAKEREADAIQESRSSKETLALLKKIIGSDVIYNGTASRIIDQIDIHSSELNSKNLTLDSKARLLFYFGSTYRKVGQLKQAEDLLSKSLEIQNTTENQNKILLLDTKHELIRTKKFLRRSFEQTEELLDIHNEYLKLLPKDNEKIISITYDISYSLSTKRRFSECLEILSSLSGIEWSKKPNGSSLKALYYANLGSIQLYMANDTESVKNLETALEIATDRSISTSPIVLESCMNLPAAYARIGQIDLAIQKQDEITKEAVKLWGHDHPKIAAYKLNSHYLFLKSQDFEKCINTTMEAISDLGTHVPSFRYNVMIALANSSLALRHLGFQEDAHALIELVLVEKEQTHGSVAKTTLSSLVQYYEEKFSSNNHKECLDSIPRYITQIEKEEGDFTEYQISLIKIMIQASEKENNSSLLYNWNCRLLDRLLASSKSNQKEIDKQQKAIRDLGYEN